MSEYGEYEESRIYKSDKRRLQQVNDLLLQEGIQKDENLEYTMGIFDGDQLVATGSFFKNTLRCLAVDSRYQGEGLLNKVMTHLLNVQYQNGNTRVFLYTKCDKAKFFADIGFYEIAKVEGMVVFMENRASGFKQYLRSLAQENVPGHSVAAVVINANPFTLGHQYLLETAAAENDVLHVFVVSEDVSLVPFQVRYELVKKGAAHLKNVVLHETGNYIISHATFPSYFIKDADSVIEAHAKLDIEIFKNKIAPALGITKRYVGDEPFSRVTNIYNTIMQRELEKSKMTCIVLPRKQFGDTPISASRVRQYIRDGQIEAIKSLVPASTYNFFVSEAGAEVVKQIQLAANVIHY
ncbi:MAG: [citrate (pro-3S)-lyase] ligase [Veillonellales bacterium]